MRKRNYAIGAGFVLGLFAVVSYFALVTPMIGPRIPFLRDVPLLNFALLAAALLLSWIGVRRAFSQRAEYRGVWLGSILAGLNLGLAALFVWYVAVFSSELPESPNAPRVGVQAPDFTLPDQSGQPLSLADLRGQKVLLVFYRGYW